MPTRRRRAAVHGAPIAPPLAVPASLAAWRRQRAGIRRTLTRLLGSLPTRPRTVRVTTLDRELRPDFILERFEIDNGAGARISGQMLIPCNLAPGQRCPAILYHHWHGDQYDVGTRSLFERAYTPVEPGPDLVRRGYVVLAIDAYGFGARSGRGPGGPLERGRDEEESASKFNLWAGVVRCGA